jgi:hypothetical protein
MSFSLGLEACYLPEAIHKVVSDTIVESHGTSLPKLNGTRLHMKSTPMFWPGNRCSLRILLLQFSQLSIEICA